jgi:hypothetical protein
VFNIYLKLIPLHVPTCSGHLQVETMSETPNELKSSIFWDIMPHSLLTVTNILEKHVASFFSFGLFVHPENGGNMFL